MGKRLGSLVAAVVLALGALVLPGAPAYGVGSGNPVVTAPASAHYAGFTGPFTVDFEDAPPGDYDWYVEQDPADGGAPVTRTPVHTYTWSGSGADPQLRTTALPAGQGYRFVVDDHDGHAAGLAFTVRPGPAPACAILVPDQIRVNAPVERITARLAAGCAALHTDWAAWKVRHVTHGYANLFYFDGTTTDVWALYDDEPTGTYTITPNGARSTALEDVPQNTRRTVVRRDSRLAVTAKRSGGRVTLRATLRRYLPSANQFRPWASRSVTVSYRTCGTCAWHHLRSARTDRAGKVSVGVRAARSRQYRVTAVGTSTTWAPVAKYVRR